MYPDDKYLRILSRPKVLQDRRDETRWPRLEDRDDEHSVPVDVLQDPLLESRGQSGQDVIFVPRAPRTRHENHVCPHRLRLKEGQTKDAHVLGERLDID